MTNEEFAAIQARAEAATPGPWRSRLALGGYFYQIVAPETTGISGTGIASTWEHDPNQNNDSVFIAHAREDIPVLLAEIERLRRELFVAYELLDEHHIQR